MTLEEWKSLQKEFGFKIIDADYENISIEKGSQLLQVLSDNFDDNYNDDEGEDEE